MAEFLKNIKFILNVLTKDITIFGSLVFYLFIIFFIAIDKKITFALQLVTALIFAYIMVIIIRLLYYKQRPDGQKYSNLLEKIDSSSFPSMHSMRAAILFVLFLYNFGFLMAILFLVLLILVMLSRIILKRHYIFDVISGMLLGITIAIIVWTLI